MQLKSFLILLLMTTPAWAAETVTISAITGPLSFKAGDNEYVLDGLYAASANANLISGMLNQKLSVDGTKRDRWNRLMVNAPTLSLSLLREGKAQLMPLINEPTEAERAAEAQARKAQMGLWGNPCCMPLTAYTADKGINSWRVVTGRVVAVTVQRGATFLNFGNDFRTDFSVVIPAKLAATVNAQDWANKNIEVRGYVEWKYGPSITLYNAAQIVLPAPTTP